MTAFAATPDMNILGVTERKQSERYLVIYSFYVDGKAKLLALWTESEDKDKVRFEAWSLYDRSFPECKGHICRTLAILNENDLLFVDDLREIINLTI